MKTKLQIIGIALTGFILTSCSSGMYLSKSSATPTDDIYYSASKTNTIASKDDKSISSKSTNDDSQSTSSPDFAKLEEKYSKVLASDTSNIDTTIYKAENTNPYERVLSDSYQESYERRLKGMRDPRYGMENFTTYYSDDYWYASAYDPDFYRIVVMGDQVWVEPNYISSMFLWPRNNFRLGFGLGYGWNAWYYNNYYSPYYWNNSWIDYYPDWYGYPVNYSTTINNNYYYGRRTGNSTNITSMNRRTGDSYENQIVSSRRRNGTTAEAGVNRADIRTRNTGQTNIITRNGQRNTNQEVIGRGNRNENSNTTRLRGETTTRNINMAEPTRRNNNNTYQRPRSTNNEGYIRTGTRNQNSGTVDNTTRGASTIRDNRTSAPTYNRPNRVDTSTERSRTTTSGSTNRESTIRESNRNSSTGTHSGSRSSSGSSSGSNSGSSSNSGSQNNSGRIR